MGWWSEDIMGGDTPLDWEDRFYDVCKTKKWDADKLNKLTKKRLEKYLPELVRRITEQDYTDNWERNVGYQVLGVMLMEAGAKINGVLKARMIEACRKDEWAEDDNGRKKVCDGLIKALNAYDETPIIIKPNGLYEIMEEKLTGEKKGERRVGEDKYRKYYTEVNWGSTAGNPLTKRAVIVAYSAEEALDILTEKVRKQKNCMKIHGGSASIMDK